MLSYISTNDLYVTIFLTIVLEFCHKKEEKEVGRFMSFLISNNQEEGMGRIGGFLEFKK
jgi:hypothetical protein